MNFKVPLPVVKKTVVEIHEQTVLISGLSNFRKSEFINLSLLEQGSFRKVYAGTRNNKKFVIKEQLVLQADEYEKRLFLKEARLLQ